MHQQQGQQVAARDLLAERRCRVSQLMALVDAMPPDSFLALVVIMWVAVETVCGR
jgi:hypothetical protein